MKEWSEISVERHRVLSDDGSWDSYPNSWVTTPPQVGDYNAPVSYRNERKSRQTWDVVVPGWKEKINNGEIVNNDFIDVSLESGFNPLEYYAKVKHISSGRIADVYGGNWGPYYPNGASFPTLPTLAELLAIVCPDEGSLRAEAVTTAFARVDTSELEVLASLGELPETVDWFRDVLKRLIAAMAMLKKRQYLYALNQLKTSLRRKGAFKKTTKTVASGTEDYWMEWRYAIRPLIFEVQSYLAALDSKVESAVRKTARFSTFDLAEAISSPATSHTEYFFRANVRRTVTTSRSIRAGVLYSLDPEKMGWWTHLGLDAPVSAAWAITRLSFVLDWFFNIGQWIASWEPRVGLTPLSSWVVETRGHSTIDIWLPTSIPFTGFTTLDSHVNSNGGAYCNVQSKVRWVNPDRQFLPTFRYTGLKVAKVADLVVIGRKLASQLLR
jgi:hypothetical protein